MGVQGPDARNQGYHQQIEMKLCLSHYSHTSMSDAKFECGICTIFWDMASQNFLWRRERVIEFGYLPLKNGFNLKT